MSDLWGLFWGPNKVAQKAYKKHSQDDVDAAIIRELQFCLDDMTTEQIEKIITDLKEDR